MEAIVAPLKGMTFKIEHTLNRQTGLGSAMFAGMDKSNAEKCKFFLTRAGCSKGFECPFRHSRGEKSVVCKHWLRGLCKKSDLCEFLHEYDEGRMPECYFYATYGECSNGDECQYLHIDPESKIKDCPWYLKGFCKHGPECRHRHTRKVMCQNYLCGFCPEGPNCKFAHPRWELIGAWQDDDNRGNEPDPNDKREHPGGHGRQGQGPGPRDRPQHERPRNRFEQYEQQLQQQAQRGGRGAGHASRFNR